ncbi:Imm52 family immunity protein [Streptomyces hokutonensis]|uniref:Imm52 family immunity protein n=1 Tax=Streptomyces hokutonensis TaxID=1306990 RepID=UPI0005BD695D|nr:Imm52 family immunity protein [Streptomyces hokutonensis]
MRRLVRGFWGPREESVEELADRWAATLDRLALLLPEAALPGEWNVVRASGGPATPLSTDADTHSLRAVLQAARAADDWAKGTGTALRLTAAGAPGWTVEVSGLAGGDSEFLLQSLVIGIRPPAGAALPATELLTAVAEFWAPDFGDVTDDDVLDALEDEAEYRVGEPCVGRVGYLSPARGELVPDDLTAARTAVPGGGLLLDIAAEGHVDTVVRAFERLRETGALRPLPRPMDRATL